MTNAPKKYEKYGEEHRTAKSKRMARVGDKCEITGSRRDLQGHHVQPKYLDITGEGNPEFESNYMILTEEYHKYIHDITKPSHPNSPLTFKRKGLVQRLWDNPKDEDAMKRLRDIDEVLYAEFINKMLSNVKHSIRERIIQTTFISFLGTNRDLKIALRDKDIDLQVAQEKITDLEKQIAFLKSRLGVPSELSEESNIIDISSYYPKTYE